jgi:hypothetical protein
VKPKGVIGSFWDKAVAIAESVTDDDDVLLFVGMSTGHYSGLSGTALFGVVGTAVSRVAAGSDKTHGIAATFPVDRNMIVILTELGFGVGPRKPTPETMGWIGRYYMADLRQEGTKLRVTFTDGSELLHTFQQNSRAPLKAAIDNFYASAR